MQQLYKQLLKKHGPQGWWPLNGSYHPEDFSYPHNKDQQFEISLGAILTQNTNWHNVERALNNLRNLKILSPTAIISTPEERVKTAIRPAGYFNQKYKKLKIFSDFFLQQQKTPSRSDLLSLWGIGPETADSILLYAYKIPTFVIDTYTKRVLVHYQKLTTTQIDYHQLQNYFLQQLPTDFVLFQEFHALFVTEAKQLAKERYL